MKSVRILLDSIEKVEHFINDITRYDTDFDIVSGRYIVDAKSVMGILSLDISRPLELCIHGADKKPMIMDTLKPYMI